MSEPGAMTPTWRLYYAMEIGTLRCEQAQVTPVKTGESLTQFAVRKGDILIA